MTARREYDGPSWDPSCLTLNYVYMDNPEGKCLTNMTVYAGRTVVIMTIRRGTLRKKIGDTLERGL